MNLFKKILFQLKKPKAVIVCGEGRLTAKEAIVQVLKSQFKIGEEIFVFAADLKKAKELRETEFIVKKCSLPVLVVTHAGEPSPDKDFFAGELSQVEEITKLAGSLPGIGYLVLNFDDETVREIKKKSRAHPLTLGFQENADFRATDIVLTETPLTSAETGISIGTNFKINYDGNIVPVWLEKLFGKEQIYSALAAAAAGIIFDLNLVEISQALKNYQSLPGRMRLIKGIKNSWILDDSESATAFSMAEAIEILGKIPGFNLSGARQGRKIAVLGDVIGVGKYAIEAHEAIGERVAKNTDLLFTFGSRARFIAEGAKNKGMGFEKIFQFNTIDEGRFKLQDEIREGDLILVDGSKEMRMNEIIEEIKEI